MRRLTLVGSFFLVLLSSWLITVPLTIAAEPLWSVELPEEPLWQVVSSSGHLLAGSKDNLFCLDEDSGKILWQRDDIKRSSPFSVKEVPETPILIVTEHHGLGNSKSSVQAINSITGATIWKTPEANGRSVGMYPLPERNEILVVQEIYDNGRGEAGVFLSLRELSSGKELWQSRYAKAGKLDYHLSDNSSVWSPVMDLSGHQEPLLDGDRIYLPFMGVHAFDLKDGNLAWEVTFQTADTSLKRTYAPLLLENETLYATGQGIIVAINRADGNILWQEKVSKKAPLADMNIAGDSLLVRTGGTFTDTKKLQMKTPLGLIALDKKTGTEKWEFKKGKLGITNMAFTDKGQTVLIADSENLMGFDAASGKILYTEPLEFERQMGAMDLAAGGLKVGSGFLSGGLLGAAQGAFSSVKDKDKRKDVPLNISALDENRVVVSGQQHILAFNTANHKIDWSIYYAAPGSSNLMLLATGALVAVNTMANAGMHTSVSARNSAVNNALGGADDFTKLTTRRYSAMQTTERRSYFLTMLEEEKEKGPGLIGISLDSGTEVAKVYLGDKEPEYTLDEVTNRLYHIKKGKTLTAYQM